MRDGQNGDGEVSRELCIRQFPLALNECRVVTKLTRTLGSRYRYSTAIKTPPPLSDSLSQYKLNLSVH
jgi:hypothetical protein